LVKAIPGLGESWLLQVEAVEILPSHLNPNVNGGNQQEVPQFARQISVWSECLPD
jgi:hypothetical protein